MDVIGNKLLKQAKPRAKPYEIRDSRLAGFLLRVQPTGTMTFYVEYGRGKRAKLGRVEVISAEHARRRAKEILSDAYRGADPMAALHRAKAHNFGTFIDEVYTPWAEANIRTAVAT